MGNRKTILFVGSFLSNSKGTKGIAEKMRPYLDGDYDLLYASEKVNKLCRMMGVLKYSLFSNYDIVHCDIFSGQAFWVADIVRRIAGFRRKKIIVNIGGGRFLEYLGESAMRLNTFQNWMSSGMTIISPSQFLGRGLKELCNAEVQVVPNFIDLGNFPYNPDSRTAHRLLWVRAFNAGYQPEIAVEALMQVRKSYPDASLTMIGPDKGTLPQIQEMITKYNLSAFVELTGPVQNTELYTYFHSHDVYLNTTAHESFGLAVFEAASCGLPIVSTRVGELPFIWTDGENIIFCSEQTGESFAQAIDLLFSDRALMDAISRSAELKCTEYQWEAVRPAWEKLFQI